MNIGKGILFLDLVTPHQELKEELATVFEKSLDTGGFIGGPMVEGFEQAFGEFCDSRFCVGVASGTDAVRFALMAAGIRPGDIVITVPNTFIATVEAITQAGARAVFVDIDERTCNMDCEKVRAYIERECVIGEDGQPYERAGGQRVAAIVPVHLYGQMCDMDAIMALAEQYRLVVIEDACQAHGAEYFSRSENRWRRAGSIGLAAAFSFYPGKNLGACGEAGAVTTNDASIAQRIRMLRDHGQSKKYYHDLEGYNGRLDAIQAGILSVKLRRLGAWNDERRRNAALYTELLNASSDIRLVYEPKWSRPVYHLFVIRVQDRDGLQKRLGEAGIGTGIHYPIPLHLQKAYSRFGYAAGQFPVAERASREILSLPMYAGLTQMQISRVADEVLNFVGGGAQGRAKAMTAVSGAD